MELHCWIDLALEVPSNYEEKFVCPLNFFSFDYRNFSENLRTFSIMVQFYMQNFCSQKFLIFFSKISHSHQKILQEFSDISFKD